MHAVVILTAAGFVAGAMNAVAGGGSLVTLPALLACGVSPVLANASSSVALYPGSAASAWVYRQGLGGVARASLWSLTLTSLLGGLAGSLLLLATPAALFDRVLPWLLLAALLMLAFGQHLPARIRDNGEASGALLAAQALLGLYGGYFGGGVGLMMMAFWSVATGIDIKLMQAPRIFLATAANTSALFVFAATGSVQWPAVLLLAPSAIVGGYLGARTATLLPARGLRAGTLALASLVTLAVFFRAYA